MREMKKQHVEIEATLALSKLRSRLDKPENELATLIVMQNACDALDKGEYGEQAVKALIDLWRELKLEDISGASISELRAVVDQMYHKAVKASSS